MYTSLNMYAYIHICFFLKKKTYVNASLWAFNVTIPQIIFSGIDTGARTPATHRIHIYDILPSCRTPLVYTNVIYFDTRDPRAFKFVFIFLFTYIKVYSFIILKCCDTKL